MLSDIQHAFVIHSVYFLTRFDRNTFGMDRTGAYQYHNYVDTTMGTIVDKCSIQVIDFYSNKRRKFQMSWRVSAMIWNKKIRAQYF